MDSKGEHVHHIPPHGEAQRIAAKSAKLLVKTDSHRITSELTKLIYKNHFISSIQKEKSVKDNQAVVEGKQRTK